MLTLVQPRCSTLGQARGLAMAHHPWAWLNSWGAPVLLLLLLYHSTFSEPPLPASPQLDTQNLSSRTSLSPSSGQSLCLSCGSQPVPRCLNSSGLLPLLCSLSPPPALWAFPSPTARGQPPEAGQDGPFTCCLASWTQSSVFWRQKGLCCLLSWEGLSLAPSSQHQ